MFITFVALVFMKSGQPALLYLVPSVLFPVTIVALLKGQFKNLWYGRIVSNLSFFYLSLLYGGLLYGGLLYGGLLYG